MSVFHFLSAMWKIFCMIGASMSVTKRFGTSETGSILCLLRISEESGPIECGVTRSGNGAAMQVIGNAKWPKTWRWENNRAENSHLPFRQRERAISRFCRMRNLQTFASIHAPVSKQFNRDRSPSNCDQSKLNRCTAHAEWRGLCAK